MNANIAMKMPLLDVAFLLLDSARSPQDFTLILHLRNPPEIESLYAGARSAMNRFPISASLVDGRNWVWRENKYFKLEMLTTISESESRAAIERFIDEPFELRQQPPVKQLLLIDGRGSLRLVTRFHHAAADGLSAALWLGHQLNVAFGIEPPEPQRAQFVGPTLRRRGTSVRRSQFAFAGASDRLWTSNSHRSGARRWFTLRFPATNLQKACRRAGGFTYHDLLATCALEVFLQWNSRHTNNGAKIGLWVPMNVRRDATAGFGNGTSRIRLYARYQPDASLTEKCREVRRQVSWSSKHGEWVLPEIPWFTSLPRGVSGPLLRNYLNLSSVDMATGVFTHAGSWIASAGEAFKHVEQIESIGQLHPRHRVAITAATHSSQTSLTFTHDPQLLHGDEVRQLAQMYEQQIALAQQELL